MSYRSRRLTITAGIQLENTSKTGVFRATIVVSTPQGLGVQPLITALQPGATATNPNYIVLAGASAVTLVITNQFITPTPGVVSRDSYVVRTVAKAPTSFKVHLPGIFRPSASTPLTP